MQDNIPNCRSNHVSHAARKRASDGDSNQSASGFKFQSRLSRRKHNVVLTCKRNTIHWVPGLQVCRRDQVRERGFLYAKIYPERRTRLGHETQEKSLRKWTKCRNDSNLSTGSIACCRLWWDMIHNRCRQTISSSSYYGSCASTCLSWVLHISNAFCQLFTILSFIS